MINTYVYTIIIFVLLIIVALICLAKPMVKLDVLILLVFLYGLFPYTYQGFTYVGNVKELYLTDLSKEKTTGILKNRYSKYWNGSDVFQYDTYIENYDEVPYLIVNNPHMTGATIEKNGYLSGTYTNQEESFDIYIDLKKEEILLQDDYAQNEDCVRCLEEIHHDYYEVIHKIYQYIIVKSIVLMVVSMIGFVCLSVYLIKMKWKKRW